jgi:hypothetical protein
MSGVVLVGVCAVLFLTIMLSWFVLFPSPALFAIERASAHLVQPTLVLTVTTMTLVALVVRATRRDLGLDRGLVQGLVVAITGYVVIQVGLAITATPSSVLDARSRSRSAASSVA